MTDRSEERIKLNAEVFTPAHLVNDMLDKLPLRAWIRGKTFIDPACGNGNFLVAVLARKLKRGHPLLESLQSIYGVDIMEDNVVECRRRLLEVVRVHLQPRKRITNAMRQVVEQNIKWLDPAIYPKGSLDYDFGFE